MGGGFPWAGQLSSYIYISKVFIDLLLKNIISYEHKRRDTLFNEKRSILQSCFLMLLNMLIFLLFFKVLLKVLNKYLNN